MYNLCNIFRTCQRCYLSRLCNYETNKFAGFYRRHKFLPLYTFSRNLATARDLSMTLENHKIQSYIRESVTNHEEIVKKLTECHGLVEKERTELNRQLVEMGPLVEVVKEYQQIKLETEEAEKMFEACQEDAEMRSLLKEELAGYHEQKQNLEVVILDRLVPVERDHDFSVILEIQAGVGGQEAMLFAGELFEMYESYAAYRGWTYDVFQMDRTELGGLRGASVSVTGAGAYGLLRFEGGVHRVQRVPQTEKTGRIHTSTATVAVMPQPDEIDVDISVKDLRFDTFKASGKGGQHVNTTDSAVRVTHKPTGEVVECQKERSQIKNRQLALTILRSRLYERAQEAQRRSTQSSRRLQVGGGTRAEKIRTYNYNQDRVTGTPEPDDGRFTFPRNHPLAWDNGIRP